jgi:hypothetical protein
VNWKSIDYLDDTAWVQVPALVIHGLSGSEGRSSQRSNGDTDGHLDTSWTRRGHALPCMDKSSCRKP